MIVIDDPMAYSTLARVCVTELSTSETEALIAELSATEETRRGARGKEKQESAKRRESIFHRYEKRRARLDEEGWKRKEEEMLQS